MNRSWSIALILAAGTAVACGSSSGGEAATPAGGGSGEGICDAQYSAALASCAPPTASRSTSDQYCLAKDHAYAGFGCQAQLEAWLRCTSVADFGCAGGPSCDEEEEASFTCLVMAEQRTSCHLANDEQAMSCQDASKTYAFTCAASPAAACSPITVAGVPIWCCPRL